MIQIFRPMNGMHSIETCHFFLTQLMFPVPYRLSHPAVKVRTQSVICQRKSDPVAQMLSAGPSTLRSVNVCSSPTVAAEATPTTLKQRRLANRLVAVVLLEVRSTY